MLDDSRGPAAEDPQLERDHVAGTLTGCDGRGQVHRLPSRGVREDLAAAGEALITSVLANLGQRSVHATQETHA